MHMKGAAKPLTVRSTPLSVAFSQAEREQVQAAAYLSDQTVSAFIRAAAVRAAARVTARVLKAAA